MALTHLHPAAAAGLAAWHRMIAEKNLSDLDKLIHADAVFRSPMAFKPYESGQAVALILRTVFGVFEDFAYHRELASEDGLSVVLEFSARVGERQLKGVDLIRFDDAGQIVDFEVMIRPMSALQALGAEMGARLGAVLPQFKAKTV
ncbi:MAG: nuclear transport factor 2 family protein [Hyphomonadaceae bacterium]